MQQGFCKQDCLLNFMPILSYEILAWANLGNVRSSQKIQQGMCEPICVNSIYIPWVICYAGEHVDYGPLTRHVLKSCGRGVGALYFHEYACSPALYRNPRLATARI